VGWTRSVIETGLCLALNATKPAAGMTRNGDASQQDRLRMR
jgi:hypothetical protein